MLNFLADLIIKKYRPKVIGITGALGKTSTREAVYTVLSGTYTVARSQADDNNISALLAIVGVERPPKHYFGWLGVFAKAVRLLARHNHDYPQMLILEMGVDRRGRLNSLLTKIRPSVIIVTSIGPVQDEHFRSVEEIIAEKAERVSDLPVDRWVVLNIDDGNVARLAKHTNARVARYGFKAGADVRAGNLKFSYVENDNHIENLRGVSFKVAHRGATVPLLLPDSLGAGQVYAALAALTVGTIYGLHLVEMTERLRAFRTPPGRMALIAGIKNTLVIDDTYNAVPVAALAALDVLVRLPLTPPGRRLAVIGDIREVGFESVQSHANIGRAVAKHGIDMLITVGERSRDIARAAKKVGLKENALRHFAFAREAKAEVQKSLQSGDIVLVTGASSMRMEEIVKEIMKDPRQAQTSLVRQPSTHP